MHRGVLLIFFTIGALGAQQARRPEQSGINAKRLKWFWGQRMYPGDTIPHQVRLEAIRKTRALTPHASLSTSTWTSIGPRPLDDGTGVIDSGRVWALAVDPRNSAVVYAGADGGGSSKTTDARTHRTPITDEQTALGASSLGLRAAEPGTNCGRNG